MLSIIVTAAILLGLLVGSLVVLEVRDWTRAQRQRRAAAWFPPDTTSASQPAATPPRTAAVVRRVVAGSDQTRSDPPTEQEKAVDLAVWLLARDAVERARPGLVAPVVGAKRS